MKQYYFYVLKSLQSKTMQNVVIFTFGTMVAQALSFLTLPILTRYLTTGDFGIYNYTFTIMNFLLVVSSLSLNSYVLRHYFEINTNEDKGKLFGTIFIFIILFNGILLFLEFWIISYLITLLHIQIPFDPYFKIALASNYFEIFGMLPLIYFRIMKQAWNFLLLSASKAVLFTSTVLILVMHYKMGVMGFFYGMLFVNLIFVPVYFLVMLKISRFSFDMNLLKKGLKFSLPIVPSAFASMAMQSIDRLVLERYVDLSHIGIYSVGVALGSALLILVRGFFYAIEPVIYEAFKKEDFNRKIVLIKDKFLFLVLLLGCILIIFCKEIITLMVSTRFYEAYKIIPVYVVSCIFSAAQVLITTTIFAINKTVYQPFLVGIALVINLTVNIILIPVVGIVGAATASAISCWSLYVMSAYITKKHTGIKWGIVKDTLITLLFCSLSVLIMNFNFTTLLYKGVIKVGGVIAIGSMLSLLSNVGIRASVKES